MWVARPFWEDRGLFTAKETTSTKNAKCFSDARLLFLKDVPESCCHFCQITWLRCSLRKERVLEKNTLSRFSIWGQMRCWQVYCQWHYSIVIFVTYEIKSLSPLKKTKLSCQMLYCAGDARSSIALARTRRRSVMLYNFTKAQKLQALQQYSTMKVAYSTNKSHNCTACVCFEGFAWRCDIHSIQEQFPRFINSPLGCF